MNQVLASSPTYKLTTTFFRTERAQIFSNFSEMLRFCVSIEIYYIESFCSLKCICSSKNCYCLIFFNQKCCIMAKYLFKNLGMFFFLHKMHLIFFQISYLCYWNHTICIQFITQRLIPFENVQISFACRWLLIFSTVSRERRFVSSFLFC